MVLFAFQHALVFRQSDHPHSGIIVTTSSAAAAPVLEESHQRFARQAEMSYSNEPLSRYFALLEGYIVLSFYSAAVGIPWILVSGRRRSSTRRKAGIRTRSES